MGTYNDTVVPGKDGQFVQPSDEIPTRSDISGNENANSQGGERVHAREMIGGRRKVGM